MLTFRLTVTDDDGLLATDDLSVTEQDNGITQFPDNVLTLVSAGGNVGVRAAAGNNIVELRAVDATTITDQTNRPTSLPNGLISVVVRVQNPGARAEVVYFLNAPAAAGLTWVKYSTRLGWQDFGSHAVFNADRTQVTVTLTDGGAGDDDGVANGVIVDPSGPGSFTRATGTPGPGTGGFQNGSSGGGGCAVSGGTARIDPLLALLALLALARLAASRRRQELALMALARLAPGRRRQVLALRPLALHPLAGCVVRRLGRTATHWSTR